MGASGVGPRQQEAGAGGRPVHRVAEVTAQQGEVDFRDHEGLVEGDVHRGAVVRGDGDVRICGGVNGVLDHPCRVEVTGDVVVEGSVVAARLRGRRIRIGGDVSGSRLTADFGVEVAGSFVDSEASLGNRTADLAWFLKLRAEYERLETQLGELKVKVGSAGRRFARDYPQVDLTLGGIIVASKREIRVDLSPFYKAVSGRSPAEVDSALDEFYLKVIVGSLTRANRHYVSRNPSRQKIFLKLIEELRGHLRTVREADRVQEAAGGILKERQALLDGLKRSAGIQLKVKGKVCGKVAVRLVQLCRFEGTAAGAVDIEKSQIEARAVECKDGAVLETTDAEGVVRAEPVGNSGLSQGAFCVKEGRIAWQPGP